MILVVDDEESLAEVMTSVLQDEGYDAVAAHDGLAALDLLRQGPRPCLAFVDLMMPGMDGWQLRRAMLAEPALAAIPVVIVSAFLTDAVAALRPAGVIPKPFHLGQILEAADRHCRAEVRTSSAILASEAPA